MEANLQVEEGRKFLKSPINTPADMMPSDEDRKTKAPPFQKGHPKDAKLIDLVSAKELSIGNMSFVDVVRNRRSRRKYTDESLTLEEISFLLWAVQGIQRVSKKEPVTYRTPDRVIRANLGERSRTLQGVH